MTRKSLTIEVKPEVLSWARESAGYSVADISRRLGVTPNTFQRWESGPGAIGITTLKKLAKYLKRPLAVFFLSVPPPEPSLATSFRILPKEPQMFSKELLLAIRRVRRLQSVANELMRNLENKVESKISKFIRNDNPVEIARREREQFGVNIQTQFLWRNSYEAFGTWRHKIEERNILVFQFPIPLQVARGFSLMDVPPYAITISSSDNILPRIFTLFHEYAHLLLGISEIYTLNEEILTGDRVPEIEKWCNNFAGEFLMPESALRENKDFQMLTKPTSVLPLKHLQNVSRQFKVSQHAVLVRLRCLDKISQEQYQNEVAKLQKKSESKADEKFFPQPPPKKCIGEKGRLFTSLVLENKQKGFINYSDMADFLSIKLKYLDKMQALLMR